VSSESSTSTVVVSESPPGLGRGKESREEPPCQGRHLLVCLRPHSATEQGMRMTSRVLKKKKKGEG